ncbi:hypothetical protein MMC14_000204 [Varicellaria rhodocarpa]|nr:hypothetical protein [Varicellaria rhodocarpa]
MKVKFRNAQDGKGVELELEGDAGNNTGVINCGDMGTVVTIRKTNSALTSLFTGNYQEVTISPNVDRVLAVGLVICINERWEYSSKEKDPKEELLRGAVEELRDLSQGG